MTFAGWMNRKGWLEAFTRRARPGAYLRVLAAGEIQASDPVVVEFRPDHGVTIGKTFRALTLERDLLPDLLEASQYLDDETVRRARNRELVILDEDD